MLKIRFRHYRSIFHQKNEEKKFHRKIDQKRPNRGAGGGPRGGWQKTILFPDFFFATFPNTFKHKFNISLFQPVKASSQSMPRMPQTEKGKSGKGGNGKKVRGLLFGFLEKLGTLYQPPWRLGHQNKKK